MKTKKILIFGLIGLTVLAVALGLVFFFLANRQVKQVPNSLEVVKMNGDFHLVSQYGDGFEYQFKIEQQSEGKFTEVALIDSATNSINLSEQKISVTGGVTFRFYVRFVKENAKGKFGKPLVWSPEVKLDTVDYSSICVDADMLTWGMVEHAVKWKLQFVDMDGQFSSYETDTNQFDLSKIKVGKFRVYISAISSNEKILPSDFGDGADICVRRKNNITSVVLNANSLAICCTEQVERFEFFVRGRSIGVLLAEEFEKAGSLFLFRFNRMILAEVTEQDIAGGYVTVCSLASQFLDASDLVTVR